MSNSEIKELIEIDKISLKHLPKISFFVPFCKRLGADEGDLIEIIGDKKYAYQMKFSAF
jgi:DNA-directed RNA polymerase subunit H (RpoH/RPB5)